MPDKTQQLIDALHKLPADEREKRAAAYLEDLQQHRMQREEAPTEDPYSALKILRDAHLPGPEDASVTYEEKLYGRSTDDQ